MAKHTGKTVEGIKGAKGARAPRAAGGKRRRVPVRSYSKAISGVFRQVEPSGTFTMSGKARAVLNSVAVDVVSRLTAEATELARAIKHDTMQARDVQAATRLIFKGAIAKHAVTEGTKALLKYADSMGK